MKRISATQAWKLVPKRRQVFQLTRQSIVECDCERVHSQSGVNKPYKVGWADHKASPFISSTDKTIVIPGHGPVGTRSQLIEFRDMLSTLRDNVAALKRQGKSLDEVIAAKPSAAFDVPMTVL
jgi:hypothetical protein